jgi:predicted kinase
MKRLIMIVGVPGSGKTTKAKQLINLLGDTAVHYEADQYFTDADGTYKFDPSKLAEAHDYCQSRTSTAMKDGVKNIIVSNTFIKAWERAPYFHWARMYGYDVLFIRMNTQYKTIHGVPAEKIEIMKSQIEQLTEHEIAGLTVEVKQIGGC